MSNTDEEANEELLEHLKIIDAGITVQPRSTLRARLANAWKPLKVKTAMAHIGLMVSLAVYCVVGGIVSTSIYLHFVFNCLHIHIVPAPIHASMRRYCYLSDIACLAHMVGRPVVAQGRFLFISANGKCSQKTKKICFFSSVASFDRMSSSSVSLSCFQAWKQKKKTPKRNT